MTGTQSLADSFDDYVESLGKKRVVAEAHAAVAQGKVVQLTISTGLTSAPANNDREGFFGVAAADVASGARGEFVVDGYVKMLSGAAIDVGELLDCSADMKVDPTSTQTDGNAFARACEATTSGADELIWCKIL